MVIIALIATILWALVMYLKLNTGVQLICTVVLVLFYLSNLKGD